MSDDLAGTLRWYAKKLGWSTEHVCEARKLFDEAADRIEALQEECTLLGRAHSHADEGLAQYEQRIEALEAALREIITDSGTGWVKAHPIEIASRALEGKP